MIRVGVLGGTRFIGFHLVSALLKRGHQVVIFHRGKQRELEPFPGAVVRVLGDRDRPDSLAGFFAEPFDAVYDLSGYTPRQVEPLLSRWGNRVGQYLFCGTSSVYRLPPPEPFDEDAPRVEVPGSYGGDKAAAEAAVLRRPRGTVFRPQAVFGPFDAPQAAYVWRRARAGEPVLLRPAAAGRRLNPVWVGDLIDVFLRALGNERAYGWAFNVAGPEIVTPESFVALAAEVSGLPARLAPLDPRLAGRFLELGLPWLTHDLVASTRAASTRLGATFTPLREALARTWEWCRADPGCLTFRHQRWEQEAAVGRLPGPGQELAWRLYDRLRSLLP